MRHTRGQGGISSGNADPQNGFANRDQYNKPDFITNYENAKFFVIKSYSEDDIHKSIKYNVWASTPVGNKRLDSAYQEALTKCGGDTNKYPVFLFFSVSPCKTCSCVSSGFKRQALFGAFFLCIPWAGLLQWMCALIVV